ncbi:G-protein coupled receptor Mth2-like [Cataglyphis hispanica]|uniref:G-protein coupled receptor Mth2-like n=1 Tax=Cataglyphis hispanica TaxID=1086592 RepID=UPI00217F6445|nr:G-protein coupled receptor Mth2-like [Cataglyphis hispanica]
MTCRQNLTFWCCTLFLLFASSSKSQQNFTPDKISIAATDDKRDNYIKNTSIINMSFQIASVSFLMSTCLVYSILSELRNVHSFILCNYTSAMSVGYTISIVSFLIKEDSVDYSVCITNAFSTYFCFLASFFWLSIMSFDMWWTFRRFSSLQKNVRQREKRKLVFYSIFAWDLPFFIVVITVIVNYVSECLPEILRPSFREGNCWFPGTKEFVLYIYGYESICIISSICLSISTVLKIARYEKDISHLTDSESKRYNDNKKWFILCLKLFILQFITMGIKWSMMIWPKNPNPSYCFLCVLNLMKITPHFCVFIIFLCKKDIKRMLLKQFGCGLFLDDQCSTNVTSLSTSSCITSGDMSMQKKMNSCKQRICEKDRTEFQCCNVHKKILSQNQIIHACTMISN